MFGDLETEAGKIVELRIRLKEEINLLRSTIREENEYNHRSGSCRNIERYRKHGGDEGKEKAEWESEKAWIN